MELTDTEWRVMNVLWTHSPARVRDVYEALELETGWAYSTVKTILSRLADKGAVSAESEGQALSYVPLVSRQDARRTAVKSLLERAFGGTFGALVHHVLEDRSLTAAERRELKTLIDDELERTPRRRGKKNR